MSVNAIAPIFLAQSGMVQAQKALEKSALSIASGLNSRINPADEYVASKLDTTIRSAKAAISNAQNGYNFTDVADSALKSISNNLQRIRELSIQASNGIYSEQQTAAMQAEVNQNAEQIQQTLSQAAFNGKSTLNVITPENPDAASTVDFFTGSNSTEFVSYDPNVALGSLNFDISTSDKAVAALAQVDTILDNINSKRGEIGAVQTSLEAAVDYQTASIMSYASSLSGVQDTDYVSAIADLKKSQYTMEAMAKVMKAVMNSERYVLDLLK